MKIFTLKKSICAFIVAIFFTQISFAQTSTDLFIWNYQDLDLVVDVDNAVGTPTMTSFGLNAAQYFTGMNAACSGTTTGENATSNQQWNTGDYHQFEVNTTGFTDLTFSVCLRTSSGVNGTNFRVRASTDLTNWTTIVNDFNFGTATGSVLLGVSGALPATFNNQATVYIQLYKIDDAGSTTTAIRVDNVKLTSAPPVAALYFQSVASGSFATAATWESSTDNSSWAGATRAPLVTDNTITIQAGHNVNINAAVTIDQVIVKPTATLSQAPNAGIITLNDGAGDDLVIENGGVFHLEAQSSLTVPNAPQNFNARMAFAGTAPVVKVETGGIVRIGSGDGTYVGTGFAGMPTNINNIWQHGAIYEWNNNSNIPLQGTFFPNATAGVLPIVKTMVAIPGYGGSSTTALVLNGLFEANNIVHVGGTTTKTFRDGIHNADSLIFGANVGKVIFGNGTNTTTLTGAGPILIPDAGMDIAASTEITLPTTKTIAKSYGALVNPTLNMLTGAKIFLGANTLQLKARATSAGGHIVTNGSGKLRIDSIDNAAGTVLFPVGPNTTNYNPATIANTGTLDDFSVNVAATAPGCTSIPANTVELIFDISEATAGGSFATLALDYTGATNAGAMGTTAVIAHCNGSSVDYSGGVASGNVVTLIGAQSFSPFFVTNGSNIVPVKIISFNATKRNNVINVNWVVADEVNIANYVVEKSSDGVTFSAVKNITAINTPNYAAIDETPFAGTNYYRLRIVEKTGTFTYSAIARVEFDGKSTGIKVFPTVTNNSFTINTNTVMVKNYVVINAQGKVMLQGRMTATQNVNIASLPAGTYQVKVDAQNIMIIKN